MGAIAIAFFVLGKLGACIGFWSDDRGRHLTLGWVGVSLDETTMSGFGHTFEDDGKTGTARVDDSDLFEDWEKIWGMG